MEWLSNYHKCLQVCDHNGTVSCSTNYLHMVQQVVWERVTQCFAALSKALSNLTCQCGSVFYQSKTSLLNEDGQDCSKVTGFSQRPLKKTYTPGMWG